MVRLCSSSLSRQEILRACAIPFVCCANGFSEESVITQNPESFAYQAALGKHKSALELYGLELPLLVADSVVSCQGVLQRKAKSKQEAYQFLQKQSGSALCVVSCTIFQTHKIYYLDLSKTCFVLHHFLENDMRDYLESGLWENKAGAVMVEGFHKRYIQSQIGTTSNAMGLNIESLLPFLKEAR